MLEAIQCSQGIGIRSHLGSRLGYQFAALMRPQLEGSPSRLVADILTFLTGQELVKWPWLPREPNDRGGHRRLLLIHVGRLIPCVIIGIPSRR